MRKRHKYATLHKIVALLYELYELSITVPELVVDIVLGFHPLNQYEAKTTRCLKPLVNKK